VLEHGIGEDDTKNIRGRKDSLSCLQNKKYSSKEKLSTLFMCLNLFSNKRLFFFVYGRRKDDLSFLT